MRRRDCTNTRRDCMFSLSAETLAKLRELCREHGVRELHVFGSAADPDGAFEPDRSDIDLLVEFLDGDLGPWLKRFFDFQQACETLFGRKVDLVLASALRGPHTCASPFLLASIEASKARVYPAA